jgi:hypothetical protein
MVIIPENGIVPLNFSQLSWRVEWTKSFDADIDFPVVRAAEAA